MGFSAVACAGAGRDDAKSIDRNRAKLTQEAQVWLMALSAVQDLI
jgi:hypothetical protein